MKVLLYFGIIGWALLWQGAGYAGPSNLPDSPPESSANTVAPGPRAVKAGLAAGEGKSLAGQKGLPKSPTGPQLSGNDLQRQPASGVKHRSAPAVIGGPASPKIKNAGAINGTAVSHKP
jgi:hypothetical protein